VLSLCHAIQLQSHLTSLDLSGNTISDDGAAALLQAVAIQHKQCITAITSKNMMPGKRSSSSSSGLTTLDIGHNLITSTGGKVSNLQC
jgi:Leucine-rich repeat (LRR) protein